MKVTKRKDGTYDATFPYTPIFLFFRDKATSKKPTYHIFSSYLCKFKPAKPHFFENIKYLCR